MTCACLKDRIKAYLKDSPLHWPLLCPWSGRARQKEPQAAKEAPRTLNSGFLPHLWLPSDLHLREHLDFRDVESVVTSASGWLCDLGQIKYPLWALMGS